jgi:steroid delta-isomerase-like uncharacterized protein
LSARLERRQADPLADAWEAAWTGGGEGFAVCCTPDVQYEDPLAAEPLHGVAELEEQARRLRSAFPDLRVERPSPAVRDGSHACIPWRLIGTHRGEVGPLPATSRFLIVHGLHYAEISDGLIRRVRGFFDLYEVATQLGLLPARGSLAESALLLLRGFGLRRRPPT